MPNKFYSIDYLSTGDKLQKSLYDELMKLNIISNFRQYDPKVVGTIPINIYTVFSDVDILFDISNRDSLNDVNTFFENNRNNLTSFEIIDNNSDYLHATFLTEYFKYEIYGIKKQTHLQYGFIHMIIEDRIIRLLGNSFKNEIIQLKNSGMKTEPAFCKLLNITEDPYEVLYNLYFINEIDFMEFIKKHYYKTRIA